MTLKESQGLSQSELGKILGKSRGMISDYERGRDKILEKNVYDSGRKIPCRHSTGKYH